MALHRLSNIQQHPQGSARVSNIKAHMGGEGPHMHVPQVRLHGLHKQEAQHGRVGIVCSAGRAQAQRRGAMIRHGCKDPLHRQASEAYSKCLAAALSRQAHTYTTHTHLQHRHTQTATHLLHLHARTGS